MFSVRCGGGRLQIVSRRVHRLRARSRPISALCQGGRATMRSPLRRPGAAQIVSGTTVFGVVAALAVVAAAGAGPASGKAAGPGSQAVLAAAQRPGTTVSVATSRQLASIGSQVDSLI